MLAGFAGIGAAFLVGVFAQGIVLESWFLRIIVTDGPPPRYDVLLLPVWLVGSYVAVRVGRLRAVGVVALYAVASLSVPVFRAFESVIQCALAAKACGVPVDLSGVTGMAAWIVVGLVLGVVLARLIPLGIPVWRGLAAVSVFAIGTIAVYVVVFMVARYTVCFSPDFIAQCLPQENLFFTAGWIAEGVLAGIVFVRLGGGLPQALGLGGLLALGYLPTPLYQAGMAFRDGLLNGLAFTAPLLGMLTFVVVAFVLHARRTFPPRAATARPG